MYTNTIPGNQLATWLSTALIPVTLQTCLGGGWVLTSVAVAVCALVGIIVGRWGKMPDSRVIAVGEVVFLIVLLSQLIGRSAACWPGDNDPAVPLILLALAAWSVQKGAEAAARVGCVLFWLIIILYTTLLGTAADSVKMEWLRPVMGQWRWNPVIALLIPSASVVLRKKGDKRSLKYLLPGAVLIIGSCVAVGVLSQKQVDMLADPFYTMSQSLRIFDFAQRFDAVLSAGMTVGWYALMCLLLCIGAAWMEKMKSGWSRYGAWLIAIPAAVCLLCNLHIEEWLLVIFSTIFWVVLPLITQGLEAEKKS